MWTGSWETVLNGVGILIGLGLAAIVLNVVCAFSYSIAEEICRAGKWLEKLDERFGELEEKIKMNSHHIDRCHDSGRRVEGVLLELREAIKADSKEMAKDAVDEAANEILKTL
jgi:uncharacterized coiled-coil DUF342 family protein